MALAPALSQRRRRRGIPFRRPSLALGKAAIVLLVLATALAGCTSQSAPDTPAKSSAQPALPSQTARVCGSPILDSPFHYQGRAGKYTSGVAGLPTYGKPGTDFPNATAGVILPPGQHSYASFQLSPNTVYYLLPGKHVGSFQPDANDAFVGGYSDGARTVVSGEYSGINEAFDANFSAGNQSGVTIEYLTIEKFQPQSDGAAMNQGTNTGWTFRSNTITLNVPGAGVLVGADNTLAHNCMTLNGQYGFQSSAVGPWGRDSVTGGPYNVTIVGNEISYNDTCDFEGLLNNPAAGWSNHNPVPSQYRNPHCGKITPNGNQGGFKLWQTNGVSIRDNYIHNNWGPGIWADTNNANTTYVGNVITANDNEAIIEEISYNFSIRNNYLAYNGWAGGLGNPKFPSPVIYISQSGSDNLFGGVPACPEASCAGQKSYPDESVISGNTLVDNGGGVFLWQDANRFCSAGFDNACTLPGGKSRPFTSSSCKSNLPSESINTTTYIGRSSGSPALDWWNGCLWRTSNVKIANNVIDFNPANIAHCDQGAWPDCGATGIFADYGITKPYNQPGGWVIPSQLTFFQGNTWSDNVYNGPSTFFAWNQGNSNNPVSWGDWTGKVAKGDKCGSAGERQSGACTGTFGQDSGSTYHSTPVSSVPTPSLAPAAAAG